jgi:hypothetical protein
LVIVSAVQAGFFLWQLDLIRKGLVDAKESADAATESAKAAKDSAEAAIRQAKASEESFAKLERPYLFVFRIGTLEFDSDYEHFFALQHRQLRKDTSNY